MINRRWIAVTAATLSALGMTASGLAAAPVAPHAHASGIAQFTLTAPVAVDDEYGYSAEASGKTVIVGAFSHKVGTHTNEGEVFVFTRPTTGWRSTTPVATLTSPNGGTDDQFGEQVAISGRLIVVGANDRNSGTGAVYVYTEPKTGWKTTSHPTAQLSIAGATTGDHLGDDVGISGDTIIAGAEGRDVGSHVAQGVVAVFTKPASGWHNETQQAELWASDGVANDGFGSYASISGNTIVGGSWAHNSFAGDADVFVKPASGWANGTETTKLLGTGVTAGDEFGTAVSISGDTVAVGAPVHSASASSHGGAVFLYQKPASGWAAAPTLSETAEISETNGVDGSYFGEGTDIAGGLLMVGATNETVGAHSRQGAVYPVFRPLGGWTTSTTSTRLLAADGQANDGLGSAVAIGDGEVVGGADQGHGGRGAAYLWATPGPNLTKVKQSHKSWRLGGAKPATNPHRVSHRRGSVFSLTLNEAAEVSMVFSEKRHGHFKHVGTLKVTAHAGHNTEFVAGKLGHGKRLKPGHCKVKILANNANGRTKHKTLHFKTHTASHHNHHRT